MRPLLLLVFPLLLILISDNRALATIYSDSVTNNIVTTKVLRKGLYKNLKEFKTNSPTITKGNYVVDMRPDREIISTGGNRYRLYIADNKGKLVRLVQGPYWGYCDGKDVYIRAPKSRKYVDLEKLEVIGPYCYFLNHSEYMYGEVAVASVLFGIVGAVITHVATEGKPIVIKPYVMNFNKGRKRVLGLTEAEIMLKKDPELREKLGPARKYKGDPKDIVIEFNKRNPHVITPF